MIRGWSLPLLFLLILILFLPVQAHVTVSAGNNDNINAAFSVESPVKSCVIYGDLPHAGDVTYYRFSMNAGDRLSLSLMTPGNDTPLPEMIILSPAKATGQGSVPVQIRVPAGYAGEIISGQKPVHADYDPFSPGAVFEVANYSRQITVTGTYYVAVVSPADETRYSLAVGYLEGFTPAEWVLVPVNGISTYLWEGQSDIAVVAPFLAVIVFGLVLIARREHRKGNKPSLPSWLASCAGLSYLGGAAITLVQMGRALRLTGPSPAVAATLVFAIMPVVLGLWMLRIARSPALCSLRSRVFLALIGALGLVFWAGLIIGPLIAFAAAAVPGWQVPPASPQE
jgi:hypothetical protein